MGAAKAGGVNLGLGFGFGYGVWVSGVLLGGTCLSMLLMAPSPTPFLEELGVGDGGISRLWVS